MANRTIEAVLRLSAKLGPTDALTTIQKKLGAVYKTAEAANVRQSAFMRTTRAMYADIMPLITRYAGPAAIAYGAYNIGKAASTMEDALFGIQKKTGATEAQLEQLREQIKGMARDVPVSMSEIAAAFERGGAAGIPLDQLEDFSRLTVKVADAWDMAAEDVGNAFAGFSAGMGVARDDLEEFADLINYLADSGIADEKDIVDFVDRVGASLKNFGLAKEEIAAYGAAMLNLKIPAEVAARAMDTLTGKLIAPGNLSEGARNALGEIVGDLEKFAKLIETDASGALELFWNNLQKFSNADRAALLGGLLGEGFDDEVMRLSAGLGELSRNIDMVGNRGEYIGGISEAAERKMKLWSSQVQLLKNNFEGLGDSIGAPVLDQINKLLTGANEMIDRQSDVSTGRAKLTQGGFSEADYRAQWQERYRKIHGDAGWSPSAAAEMNERYRSDLAAYGRGEIRSIYGNLDQEEAAARGRETLLGARDQYAALEDMRRSAAAAGGGMPVPSANPRAMALREQYALYGAETAAQRRVEAYRRLNEDPTQRFLQQGVQNPVGNLESRLNAAGMGRSPTAQDMNRFLHGDMADGKSFRELMKIEIGPTDAAEQKLTEAVAAGGEKAGNALQALMDSAGQAFAAAAARSLKEQVGSMTVNVNARVSGGSAPVNADLGVAGVP